MDNRFKEGDLVYAIEAPQVQLQVRRYVSRIYYCTIIGHLQKKEKVYFDRELMSNDLSKTHLNEPGK